MKFATFITGVKPDKSIQIPQEVCRKLRIEPDDKVEISLKKIKSGKLDLYLSENPLHRLLDLPEALSDSSGEES